MRVSEARIEVARCRRAQFGKKTGLNGRISSNGQVQILARGIIVGDSLLEVYLVLEMNERRSSLLAGGWKQKNENWNTALLIILY